MLVIPYGPSVSAIREKTPRLSAIYLFPAAREQVRGKLVTMMAGVSKPSRDFGAECAVDGWVLHDCRRVAAVGLQQLGTKLEIVEALLKHVSGTRAGVAGVYQRYDFQPELRTAVQKWEEYLQALPPTSEGRNV